MQIDKPGPGGDTTALHQQIEGSQGRTDRRHDRQHGQLGLKHPLLLATEPDKAQIREAGAFTEGDQQTGGQSHQHLGKQHAQHQAQRRQLQHRERQIQARQRVTLTKRHGQQGRQPEAPAPGHGGGGPRQGRRQGDPQGCQGSK